VQLVTVDHHRFQSCVDRAVGLNRSGVSNTVGGQLVQPYLGPLERPVLIEAGQQEEILDQGGHAVGLPFHAPHGLGQLFLALQAPGSPQLGVALDRGEGCAQLVRRVGSEASNTGLGRLPCTKGVLDPFQHGVEGLAQAARLRLLAGMIDPAGKVPAGDGVGAPRHVLEWVDTEAEHPPGDDAEGQQDGDGASQLDQADAPERGVDLVEAGAHDG